MWAIFILFEYGFKAGMAQPLEMGIIYNEDSSYHTRNITDGNMDASLSLLNRWEQDFNI